MGFENAFTKLPLKKAEIDVAPAGSKEAVDTELSWQNTRRTPGDTENVRAQMDNLFGQHNVVSFVQNPESGTPAKVIDEQALHDAVRALMERSRTRNEKRPRAEAISLLPTVIGDEPVLTREQIAHGDWQPKQFFYLPANTDAATDSVAIKNSPSFHHFVTDYVFDAEKFAYPTTNQSREDISGLEAKSAALMFHPTFGDGFRNEKNRLYVRDPNTREYKLFSGNFLREYGISPKRFEYINQGITKTPENARGLREGVTEELPNLVRKKLIRPVEDFKQMTFGRANIADQRVERAGVLPSGERMFRGVKHYIGKQFIDKPVRIVEISPTLGAVIDVSNGSERVTHTFNIIPRERAKAAKSNMFLAGAPLTQTRPFSAESIAFPRRNDETLEQYHDRTEKTDRGLAHLLLEVIPKHPELSEMLRGKPEYEIASLAQAAYLLERDKQSEKFDSFVAKYGVDGARTFLVAANEDVLRDKVFEFADQVPEVDARAVFSAYGRVIDGVDKLDVYLRQQFGSEGGDAVNAITARILNRAANVLSTAHAVQRDPKLLGDLVASVDAETKLFLDSCRELKQRNELSLENIQGAELEIMTGTDMRRRAEEAAEIQNVQRDRYALKYAKYPGLQEELNVSLAEALRNPDTHFYLYKLHDKLVGWVRFDYLYKTNEQGGDRTLEKKHFASVMVRPQFAGGRLGEALIDASVEAERADDVAIEAECDPDSPELRRYLAAGFQIRQARVDDHGVPTVDIELSPSSVEFERASEAA